MSKTTINLKESPPEVRAWFARAEAVTGLSKQAIINGAVMSFIAKSKQSSTTKEKTATRANG